MSLSTSPHRPFGEQVSETKDLYIVLETCSKTYSPCSETYSLIDLPTGLRDRTYRYPRLVLEAL